MLAGFGKRFPRIGSFSSRQTDKLGACICKSSIDEDGTESFETVLESARVMPVVSTDVASGIAGHTTTIDEDAKNDEADDCSDFNHAKDELD